MSNREIEDILKKEGIYKWMIAKRLGIHESTFSRWFREPLTVEKSQRILAAVEEIQLDRVMKGD